MIGNSSQHVSQIGFRTHCSLDLQADRVPEGAGQLGHRVALVLQAGDELEERHPPGGVVLAEDELVERAPRAPRPWPRWRRAARAGRRRASGSTAAHDVGQRGAVDARVARPV